MWIKSKKTKNKQKTYKQLKFLPVIDRQNIDVKILQIGKRICTEMNFKSDRYFRYLLQICPII